MASGELETVRWLVAAGMPVKFVRAAAAAAAAAAGSASELAATEPAAGKAKRRKKKKKRTGESAGERGGALPCNGRPDRYRSAQYVA